MNGAHFWVFCVRQNIYNISSLDTSPFKLYQVYLFWNNLWYTQQNAYRSLSGSVQSSTTLRTNIYTMLQHIVKDGRLIDDTQSLTLHSLLLTNKIDIRVFHYKNESKKQAKTNTHHIALDKLMKYHRGLMFEERVPTQNPNLWSRPQICSQRWWVLPGLCLEFNWEFQSCWLD